MGKGNGIIVTPEGQNGSGWDAFMEKAKGFIGSSSFVLRSENRGASAPNGIDVLSSSRGVLPVSVESSTAGNLFKK